MIYVEDMQFKTLLECRWNTSDLLCNFNKTFDAKIKSFQSFVDGLQSIQNILQCSDSLNICARIIFFQKNNDYLSNYFRRKFSSFYLIAFAYLRSKLSLFLIKLWSIFEKF